MDVTFLLTTYDEGGNPLLEKTIESLDNQTYPIKLLIVDDASRDGTVNKLENILTEMELEYRIIQNEENIGLAKSLNKGLQNIDTEYIGRLDIGDQARKERTEKQVEYLEENPETYLLGTLAKTINQEGEIIGEWTKSSETPFSSEELRKKCYKRNYLDHPTWMVRRSLFEEIGFYNPDYRCEDYEFYLRALSKGFNIEVYPEFLTEILETHDGISSEKIKKMNLDTAKAKLKYLRHFPYPRNLYYTCRSLAGLFMSEKILRTFTRVLKNDRR